MPTLSVENLYLVHSGSHINLVWKHLTEAGSMAQRVKPLLITSHMGVLVQVLSVPCLIHLPANFPES